MSGDLTGGIDLGGTKIAARVFDETWKSVWEVTVATPQDRYETLLATLCTLIDEMERQGAKRIGVGSPGILQSDGILRAANLVADGRTLATDLMQACARPVSFVKDCRAFSLSEARFGAGQGVRGVFGLVIGTGLAGSYVWDGQLPNSPNDLAGEVGHGPLPYALLNQHDLPLLECGCGRVGCFETLCAGSGLSALAKIVTGREIAPEILSEHGDGEPVLAVWAQIMAELIEGIILAHDPEIVVLGGGVSSIPYVTNRISDALGPAGLKGAPRPRIVTAEDSALSGTRGAALYARQ